MSSATDEEIARLETPYDDDAIDPPECAVCGHEFIFELGAEAEVAVCHECASEALPRLLKRVRADAAKIARLEAEREDRREDKREMRGEIAKLRAVADAARELTRWDWNHLLDDDDRNSEDVVLGVDRINKALAALDGAKEGS